VQAGDEFLAENAQKEGVESTASGLQYKVLTKGTGTIHPGAKSKVQVHYHGTLIDGTVFDSSVERGKTISFALNQVIAGWTEGLQLMVEGDKFRFYIPSRLAYGNRAVGKIPAGSLLIFDVELIAIN
jgi:peptidylprolyl isomerase